MRAEAQLAEDIGYDGVMVSEHHAGFPGYLPNRFSSVRFFWQRLRKIMGFSLPLLLPTKPRAMLAEEIAWLSSAYPHRVGMNCCRCASS